MIREMNRGYSRWAPPGLSACLLGGLLLAGSPTASAVAAEDGPVVWMKVEVNQENAENAHVKVNIPLSMIEVFVDSVDKRQFLGHFESSHPGLDLANVWRQVRDAPMDDFVTIETDEENVRVWKDSEYFRVDVQEPGYPEPNIRIKLPLAVMDYLFDPEQSTLSFQEMVQSLRGSLPLTLLEANKEGESVRIWLEEE